MPANLTHAHYSCMCACRQLLHVYEGAGRGPAWCLLPLPPAALPLQDGPQALEPSARTRGLYASQHVDPGAARRGPRPGAHVGQQQRGGGGGSDPGADGADAGRVFCGSAFVSTYRNGAVLVWGLPPLLRRPRAGGHAAGLHAPHQPYQPVPAVAPPLLAAAAPTSGQQDTGAGTAGWVLHTVDATDVEEAGQEAVGVGGSSTGGPAWEYCVYMQQPHSEGAVAAAANPTAAAGPEGGGAAVHILPPSEGSALQLVAQGTTIASAGVPAVHTRSRHGAEGEGELGGLPAPPPTLPAGPLITLSGPRGPVVLSADAWVPGAEEAQAGAGAGAGDGASLAASVLALVAAGAVDGSVRVWRVLGSRLGPVQRQRPHSQPVGAGAGGQGQARQQQQQQQQQQQGEVLSLASHALGVMRVKFGLMPVAPPASSMAGSSCCSSQRSSAWPDGYDVPHDRRLVLVTGAVKEVKVRLLTDQCTCELVGIERRAGQPVLLACTCLARVGVHDR